MSRPKSMPDMPQEIKDAISNGSLYIFIGAGVSRLYGYPSWNQLGKNLIDKAVGCNAMTRSEQAALLNGDFNSMQFVTIAYNKLERKIGASRAQELIKNELSISKQNNNQKIVEKIAHLLSEYNATIITTNADKSLDTSQAFKKKNIISNFREWDGDIDYSKILHIHGIIDDFASMVFTSKQYATAYMVESRFGRNLKKLFGKNKTTLFIGYGLSEFELLRYFLNPTDTPEKSNLFMLSGYLKKDDLKYEFDKEYYKSLGIEVLYYSIEKNGYHGLINVLRKWSRTLKTDTFVNDSFSKTIKNAVLNPPNKKSKKEIESYF